MAQAKVDHSTDKTFRFFLAPDLLILDDLGLHRMTQHQSIDLYGLVIARHRTASFVITSNRAVDEWLGLFDDPILGNSALEIPCLLRDSATDPLVQAHEAESGEHLEGGLLACQPFTLSFIRGHCVRPSGYCGSDAGAFSYGILWVDTIKFGGMTG